jgi:hypothetical protein
MSSFDTAFSKAAVAAMEIGEASAVTIGFRLPMMASVAFWPEFDTVLEMHRMVIEKMAASFESGFAAVQASSAFATRAAFGLANSADFATSLLTIATAAAVPVRRRARANARRLSRL